jgi:hypothetical protein
LYVFFKGDYSIARIPGLTTADGGGTNGYIAPEVLNDEKFCEFI